MTVSLPGVDTARRLERQYPDACRWLLAFSGGVDSHVLLHLLATYRHLRGSTAPTLLALHVNHGLHEDADSWQAHCARVCAELDVAFQAQKVDVKSRHRKGLERAAREARYGVFESHAVAGDLLLQAHHLDDQAETVLLRLLRGAGPLGLGGIPSQRALGAATIARPLLGFSRSDLLAYANAHELSWIDDPGNLSQGQDRNFLRHQVIPLLQQRWPDVAGKLARSADLCREASSLEEALGLEDLAGRTGSDRFGQDYLELAEIRSLPRPRLRNLMRQWLRGIARFTPSQAQLDRLIVDLLEAREDASPRLQVAEIDLRRFRDRLYRVPQLADGPAASAIPLPSSGVVDLGGAGSLHLRPARGEGLVAGGSMEVRFRSGRVDCRLAGSAVSRSLKRQLQELGVPPWLRDLLPLVYVDDRLAALGDLAICEGFVAAPGQASVLLSWQFPPGS